jgi:hypothetical protein
MYTHMYPYIPVSFNQAFFSIVVLMAVPVPVYCKGSCVLVCLVQKVTTSHVTAPSFKNFAKHALSVRLLLGHPLHLPRHPI